MEDNTTEEAGHSWADLAEAAEKERREGSAGRRGGCASFNDKEWCRCEVVPVGCRTRQDVGRGGCSGGGM